MRARAARQVRLPQSGHGQDTPRERLRHSHLADAVEVAGLRVTVGASGKSCNKTTLDEPSSSWFLPRVPRSSRNSRQSPEAKRMMRGLAAVTAFSAGATSTRPLRYIWLGCSSADTRRLAQFCSVAPTCEHTSTWQSGGDLAGLSLRVLEHNRRTGDSECGGDVCARGDHAASHGGVDGAATEK